MFIITKISTHNISLFFFSSRRRHTISYGDWSSDVCSSDLAHDGSGPVRSEHDTQAVGQRDVGEIEGRAGRLLRVRRERGDTGHPTTLRPAPTATQTTLIRFINSGTRGHSALRTSGIDTYQAENWSEPICTTTTHSRSWFTF